MTTAKKLDTGAAFQEFGTVTRVEKGEFVVRTSHGDYRARRAFGCLVEPVKSDRVLVAADTKGEAYVLQVVRRDDANQAASLSVPGDLALNAPNGKLSLLAGRGVEVTTPDEVSFVAGVFNLHARLGRLVVEQLALAGSSVQAEVQQVKTVAASIETTVQRLVERARDTFRTVTESAQLRAKRIDYVAEQMARVHAEHTVVTADGLVKVDGEQIHLG